MLSSFPSNQGHSEEQAAANLDRMQRSVAPFPRWAIERVCERVRLRGYTKKDGDRYVQERHWPPSDAELVVMIEAELKVYRVAYDSAVALLSAQVAKP